MEIICNRLIKTYILDNTSKRLQLLPLFLLISKNNENNFFKLKLFKNKILINK